VWAATLSSFYIGRGRTITVMVVNSAASLLNIVLDYVLIFGLWGFPEMGITGAALATVVAQWTKPLAYLLLMLGPRYLKQYKLWEGRKLDRRLMWRLFRFGGPSALQMTVEVGAFAIFIMVVGQLGPHATAATTLAFNVETLAWVPMLGLGIAVSTLVGQQLGADRPALAARATWTAFSMAVAFMGTMAILYLSMPRVILLGHASGADPEEFATLQATAIILLRFVAVFSVFDAMNLVFCSAVKGAGDTIFVLVTTLVSAPIPVILAWVGVRWLDLGLYWCWGVVTVWVCGLGVTYLLRFVQGKWREMRVIEREVFDEEAGPPGPQTLGVYGPGEVGATSGEW
jgi:MATE family multidrug resistance protein